MTNNSNQVYNDLQNLFEEWKQRMQKNGINTFSKDGVHYKHPNEQERYNEWNAAEKKILFIGKDPHGNPHDMADDWSCNPSYKTDKYAIYQYLYITAICKNKPDFQTIVVSPDTIKETFEKTPFCWVNVKKSAGGSTANSNEIHEHLEKYGDLFLKQLDILKPTDIVCLCGTNNWTVIEKLRSLTCQPNIYTAYHPAYFRYGREAKYQSLTPIK